MLHVKICAFVSSCLLHHVCENEKLKLNHENSHTISHSGVAISTSVMSTTTRVKNPVKKAFGLVRNVTVAKTDDNKAYTIKLNNSTLKTPLKNPFRIADETLALAVANEWKSNIGKKKLDLSNMHLTTMAYTAIDNPFEESKETVINSILEYARFDTLRFRDVDNEELLHKQSKHWDPLIGWFEHVFNCHLPIEYGDITNTNSLPNRTNDILTRHLESHQRWPLVGISFMTRNLKSFVLTSCLTERFLSVEKAVELARLETRHQTEKWSKVEWEHDLDEQSTNARVAAGTLFYHLSL